MNQFPWDFDEDLTKDRLVKVASFIAGIRDEVIDLFDEELGDTRLSLGMRAYECCRSRIIAISKDDSIPWLKILTPEGRFTFSIGKIPVRFTRNEPKYLPNRKLVVSTNTMEQMNLFGDTPNAKLRWFFVFDTHYKSAADTVYFVAYSELGDIACQWIVPIEDKVTLLSDVGDSMPQAIDVDKPKVVVKRPQSDIDKREN